MYTNLTRESSGMASFATSFLKSGTKCRTVDQNIPSERLVTCNGQYRRHIYEGSMFIRVSAFLYKQYLHDEIHHVFFQCDYNFRDLASRHAYLSNYCTSCIQNHLTSLVTDTLCSAFVATTRLTILDRLVYDNKIAEILCEFQVVEKPKLYCPHN